MIRRTGLVILPTLLVFCDAAPNVSAQAVSRLELSGGAAWLKDASERVTLPIGWNLGVAVGVNRWLSAAADISGNYKRYSIEETDVHLHNYGIMAGVRGSAAVGPFIEFGQVLFGIEHGGGSLYGMSDSVTHYAWQPGVGLDLPIGRGLALRGEFDERFLTDVHEFRAIAGIAYRWPTR